MGKIKSGDETGGKFKDKCRENSKGKKEVRFGVMEGAWIDQMLLTVREGGHGGNAGGSPAGGESHGEKPGVLGDVAKTCTQVPPHPMKMRSRRRRKRGAGGRERSPGEKSAKGRATSAIPRPLGPRAPRSYSGSPARTSARRLPKWKAKPRAQRKLPRQEGARGKRVLAPTDSRLESCDNYVIREWICLKNELLKAQREDERKQRSLEKAARRSREMDKQKRREESEEKVKVWMMKKGLSRTERVSDSNGASGQMPTASPATVGGKSTGQPAANAWKSERHFTDEQVKQKRRMDPGSGTSRTGILSSKDGAASLCKTQSTLVGDSQEGSPAVAHKSNTKPAHENNSAGREIDEKSCPKSVHFKAAKKTSRSLGHAPQVKEKDYLVSRKGPHLVCQLPFNGRLSIKVKNFKPTRAPPMEGQEAKLSKSKDLQNVVPKLENQQVQAALERKKSITIAKEASALSSVTLESGFTDVIPNAKRLQEPMVTPAVKNWFVHKMAESTMQSEGAQWSVRDGQPRQQAQPHALSPYGISLQSAEDRMSALRLSHTFRDKKAGEN